MISESMLKSSFASIICHTVFRQTSLMKPKLFLTSSLLVSCVRAKTSAVFPLSPLMVKPRAILTMPSRYAALTDTFELMQELALVLNRKRVRRGSIDFDLPEPVIEFDEQGLMQGVTRSERNVAHRLIEEFMLSANECVASYLEQRRIASLYRIHEKPDAKKIYDFESIAAAFGYSLGVGALPIQRTQLKSDRRIRHSSGRNPRPIEIPQEVHIT